ncbi:MAG: hypothetical protein ACKVT2_07200 [Saprospiraceae bacterium]
MNLPSYRMFKPAALFGLIFMFSCNSPDTRFRQLQLEVWQKFARHDFFEIHLKNEVLYMPLPPSIPLDSQRKSWVNSLQSEAQSIDLQSLSLENQKKMLQLRAVLQDFSESTDAAFFDPSNFVVLKHLQRFSDNPELTQLLDKIPAYYAQIEQNWRKPELRFVQKAVDQSQITLDFLDDLAKKSNGEIGANLAAARAAVKDFIGLCQSTHLQEREMNFAAPK